MKRRLLLAGAAPLALAACGFQLRQTPQFVFNRLAINALPGSQVSAELRRSLLASGQVNVVAPAEQPQVILDLVDERREKLVVGLNASGQVREFQLRARLRFRLRTPTGKELVPLTEMLQQRDISFTESAALSKEAEENMLYRDMLTDIVMQLMRRLAAVKSV